MTGGGRACGQRQAIYEASRERVSKATMNNSPSKAGAHQVGDETEATEVANGRLGRLGLELAVDRGDERDVEEGKVVLADAELELPHRFDEGRRLDVANSAAELQREETSAASARRMRQLQCSVKVRTSMMQTSGSWSDSSTGMRATRSTQSWMASVTCGMTCTVLPR